MARETKPKPKPAYSPQTEQDITQAMFNLALAGPRWVGEQMGEDLDEAFEMGETRVSLTKLVRHPIKTVKKLARAWTVSSWQKTIRAELVAEHVWKPRLEHFRTQGKINAGQYDFILDDWAAKPAGRKKDLVFERLEELHKYGHLDDDVWQGIYRQHQWNEFSRFRRSPTKYIWQKFFGKRGTVEAPLYKYTPQKWLGEPLGKALAKTSLGKAVAGIRQTARVVLGRVVDAAKKAQKFAGRQVIKGAKWVVTKVAGQATWASISAAVAAALGTTIAPGVGTVIGFLAGPVVFKTAEWIIKIGCLTCGCATLMFAGSMIALLVSIFGAFRPPEMGGGVNEQLIQISKTAVPDHIPADGNSYSVTYTITVTNNGEEDAVVTLHDDRYNKDFSATVAAGATNQEIGHFTVSIQTQIDQDEIIVNRVTGTALLGEETVTLGATGILIVGDPSGQPPSGWPTAKGCVTQGPGGSYSHAKPYAEAIDVGKLDRGESETYKVYATHDGVAYAWTGPDGPLSSAYGKYVEVVSHGGTFRTHYAHLFSHSVTSETAVERGTELGVMGKTGSTDGGVHVHYEFRGTYEGEPLKMEPPYIPAAIGPCAKRGPCNCCFSGFDGACGSGP